MSLSDLSLRRPVTILVVTLAAMLLGAVSIWKLRLDFLPQMEFPFIGVWAPYPNAVPEEVEREVVRPIEEVMATLGGVKHIFANCDQNGAFVGVQFDFGQPVDLLRVEVKERIDQVRPLLPNDLEETFLFTFNSNDIPIMEGRISSRGRDLSNSYDLLERRILNPLRRIEGVGRVEADGITPKQLTIYLRMDKIMEHKVEVDRVFALLNGNNVDLSIGHVRAGRQEVSVRALGQFKDFTEVEAMQISPGVRLRDIAEVVYREPAPTYRRRLNGEPAVAFWIQKASGANIVEVSRRVNAVLAEMNNDPALEGIDVVLFFDQAEQIKNSLNGLLSSGWMGSVLALGVLLLFLRQVRQTLIVSIAIPISVIGACAFLYLTGRSLNVLTMMGLMLAVGMLVDNAIVVLEAIFQRQQRGDSAFEAARSGTREVALAVSASTLTSVIVFAPVILSKGEEIAVYLGEVGVTITVTLILSLIVCLTLVPIFASRLKQMRQVPEFGFLTRMKDRYVRILRWTAVTHPRHTAYLLVPAALLLTVGLIAVTKFSPEADSERGMKVEFLRINYEFTDNVSMERAEEYVLPVEAVLSARKDSLGIESLYSVYEANAAATRIYFQPGRKTGERDLREMRKWLRKHLPEQAGLDYRLGEDQEAGKGAKTISVTLFGEDSKLLRTYAEEAKRRLAQIPDLQDVRTDADDGREEVQVILDRARAGRFDVNPGGLASLLGLTFRGVSLREFQARDREVEMGILLEPSDRRNLESLAMLPVTMVDGRGIQLDQVAHFEMRRTPGSINREEQRTAASVRASYEGEEMKDVTRAVEGTMKNLALPTGYSWSFGREMRDSQEQQSRLGWDILLALACVYFVMAALFESFLHPLVIMNTVPLAGVGVVWTLILTRTPMNIMAMIGIVILIGVIVNNGIVLIDHINQLRRAGRSRSDAVLEGCRERFRPVLMTAGTTVLGLVPLALGDSNIGDARYAPMAMTLMGGLTVGTVLTLILLPTFYVLAEDDLARVRATLRWGLGRGPLPWARPAPPAAQVVD
ncbi:MAG: efflux RND transporter permease subunit [Candidatus Eisenbacteria bacterium]|nr:efflux RND transporter permease subunit [Candidatus Eisenbacteria bacterium]